VRMAGSGAEGPFGLEAGERLNASSFSSPLAGRRQMSWEVELESQHCGQHQRRCCCRPPSAANSQGFG